MCARIWAATLCCALGCLPVVGADRSGSAEGSLVVYVSGAAAPSTAPYLRREAEALLQQAGYSIEWRDSRDRRSLDAANLVVVQLSGDCSAPSGAGVTAAPISSGRSLATTAVQDGAILPFTRVDCGALRSILAPALDREPPARRSFLLGRAMGRLIAHELYHALAQTADHASAGIGKPCFSAADLLSERFEFEAVALERLRHAADVEEVGGDATDRQ